jgi:RNA polymerase sporulation-specific sigma factor
MKKINYCNYEYIINDNIGLVYNAANRFKLSNFERDDLIQAGLMGLFRAAQRFDVTKGYTFSTYAMPFIIGEIKKEFHNGRIIKVTNYFQPLIRMISKEDGNLSYQDMAVKYQTSLENVVIACGQSGKVQSLDSMGIDVPIFNRKVDLSILDDKELELVKLKFYQHYSQNEIANLLDISQGTISRRLKRIITKLKDYFQE